MFLFYIIIRLFLSTLKIKHLSYIKSLFNTYRWFTCLLNKLYQQTAKGGSVGIVVGNSAYSGVIIPSDVLIADIAREIGFKVKNIFITRHLTTSSQQKKELDVLKNYLRESIVLLEK